MTDREGPQDELSVNEFRRELFDKMEVYRLAAQNPIPVQKAIVQQQCLDFMADIYRAAIRSASRTTTRPTPDLLRLFLCERCVEEHARNTQSISCYCDCHSSRRDEARWQTVRDQVLAALSAPAPADDNPQSQCPKCQQWQDDHDGFGVLKCEACGYCAHPSITGDKCDLCGATKHATPSLVQALLDYQIEVRSGHYTSSRQQVMDLIQRTVEALSQQGPR